MRSWPAPLIWAAKESVVEIVKLLLEGGANKEARDYWHHTALWSAEHNHRADVVKLLLNAGATE